MKHITIIGAGFAALKAVKQLRQLSQEVEITLIAPRAELHYLPGIIWIPNHLRTREDLIVPLQSCAFSSGERNRRERRRSHGAYGSG